MHVDQKRLFLGNLPSNTKEEDIKNQFSEYGNVISINIKQRQEVGNESAPSIFAFVNIEIDHNKLRRCLQEIPRQDNWHGHQIKLELAKESFLERLKREREEAQNKAKKSETAQTTKTDLTFIPLALPNKKKVYHSSESDNSENEIKTTILTNNVDVTKTSEEDLSSVPLTIKNNKNKVSEKIQIESVHKPLHVITQTRISKLKDPKSIEADNKRRQSLQQMKSSYQNQKNVIKLALSNVDYVPKNKINFEDDSPQNKKRKIENKLNNHETKHAKKGRFELFDDEDDDDNINFEIKDQFEGKSGQKLLELQSRFQSDKRFNLDSRFIEKSDSEEETTKDDLPNENEKKEQLNILESVLGRKITTKQKPENNNICVPEVITRYDPTKPEHSKFEIKINRPIFQEGKIKEKHVDYKQPTQENNVQVSTEKFYKVTDDLKKSLQEKQTFSLLNLFGKAEEHESTNDGEEKELKKYRNFDESNPFKYDSSDTEDENERTSKQKNENPVNTQNFLKTSWAESFFFKKDDERLQEGLRFMEKVFEPKTSSFEETRHKLKQILQAKVRNRLRNNKPLQKIKQRNKMIKLRQAMRK